MNLAWPAWALRPSHRGNALAGLWPAAAAAIGVELAGQADWPMPAPHLALNPTVGATKGVVLVMADSLGAVNLAARRGHAPTLAAMASEEWLTVFPSTTTTALGALGIGQPPGQTALAGYALRDPFTMNRTSLIKWETSTPPETWQPLPSYFERLAAAGTLVDQIGEARFAGSAMTRSSLRGGRFHGVNQRQQRVPLAVKLARSGARLIYLYWGEIDSTGHRFGWTGDHWARALETLDAAVSKLIGQLPAGWEVWLTADHGMVDVGQRFDVANEPALAAEVDLVAGEPRALHLYTTQPDAVAKRWAERLGDQALVLTQDQAMAEGLFGPVSDRVAPFLGNVVVAMAGNAVVQDSRWQSDSALAMMGHHGSLTAEEMRIPFLRAAT